MKVKETQVVEPQGRSTARKTLVRVIEADSLTPGGIQVDDTTPVSDWTEVEE